VSAAVWRKNVSGCECPGLNRSDRGRPMDTGASARKECGYRSMTLDVYGHLFGDRLDVVADAMEAARTAALAARAGADVDPLRTRPEIDAAPWDREAATNAV